MSKQCPAYKNALYKSNSNVTKPSNPNPMSNKKPMSHNIEASSKPVLGSTQERGLSSEDYFRGYMSLLLASAAESETPGSFEENLNHLLSVNNLPSFKTGNLKAPIISNIYLRDNRNNISGTFADVCGGNLANKSLADPKSNNECHANNSLSSAAVNTTVAPNKQNSADSSLVAEAPTNVETTSNEAHQAAPPASRTRNAKKSCTIYTRMNTNLGKGTILGHLLNAKNVVIEHYCSDITKCLVSFNKKIQHGDLTSLCVKKLAERKLDEKLALFGDI